ncbi:phage tail protein [Enterovibrio norvegicus]|uniref:phage tail sheath family protein n=1 Tax=Enterovibrio norvegicus TaxID=188144 RepID=UPI000C840427|nr:phage tail sheath C-terminal domain-containing protein [Enterovibrio norvegicus]MCC4800616.1 phage tail sheath subtilisin-like domain-containing protein [Enterovibrio norvegicus]PMI38598.1 phage tail protein [Enterovibrio norvegicus]PMN51865.1 phage tail protein [Enterovibrio norvegicus]
MPVALTYPGVYIQEIPSGSRSIGGVATSIAAFVGGFSRGPLNSPVTLFHVGDFDTHLGGVHTDSETSYAISQFYLNGGGQAVAVRVGGGTTGDMTVQSWNGLTSLRFTAGRQVQDALVEDPGRWNNHIRVDIDYLTSDPANLFNLSVSEIRHVDGVEVPVRSETFSNVSMMTTHPRYVLSVVNDDSLMVQLRLPAPGTDMPAPTGFYSGVQDTTTYAAMADANTLQVDLGTGAFDVVVDATTKPTTIAEAALMIQNAIRDTRPADPLWAQCQVVVRGDRMAIFSGRSSPDYRSGQVVSVAESVGDAGSVLMLVGSTEANVQQYAMNNVVAGHQTAATAGTDGIAPTAAQLRGNRNLRTGIYALEDVDLFNIMMIPEASDLGSVAAMSSVISPAISYCEEQRAFLLIDPPDDVNSVEEASDWLDEVAGAGLRHRNTAAYYPRVQVPDPNNENRLRTIAPSGTVAGLYARKDTESGVWTAAAGITASLRNVVSFNHALTNNEIGLLNPVGLNCLRNGGISGNIAWGARTLRGADALASEWAYIPVRRTALFIEESLFRGLQWAVFQPNDEPLWSEIRIAVTNFMQGLFRQKAFQGSAPEQAFLVKCDAETTTPADRAAGRVNVLVGFAPKNPAEFVVVSLQLMNNSGS